MTATRNALLSIGNSLKV